MAHLNNDQRPWLVSFNIPQLLRVLPRYWIHPTRNVSKTWRKFVRWKCACIQLGYKFFQNLRKSENSKNWKLPVAMRCTRNCGDDDLMSAFISFFFFFLNRKKSFYYRWFHSANTKIFPQLSPCNNNRWVRCGNHLESFPFPRNDSETKRPRPQGAGPLL